MGGLSEIVFSVSDSTIQHIRRPSQIFSDRRVEDSTYIETDPHLEKSHGGVVSNILYDEFAE